MSIPGTSFQRVVDLSHPLDPRSPIWPGDPPTEHRPHTHHDRDSYTLAALTVGEHTGTHLGAPAHYLPTGATVEAIPVGTLVQPATVIDVRTAVATAADYRLTGPALETWEAERSSRILPGIVLLLTGWSRCWPDAASYLNADAAGRLHFPGYSEEAARWLIEQRGAVGLGIDAPGVDGGDDPEFRVGRLLAERGAYHLENLTNLEQLPETGSLVVVGALAIIGGSGSPARVIALV